jgi:hypothetical protein
MGAANKQLRGGAGHRAHALPGTGTTSDVFVNQLRVAGLTLDDSWKGDPRSKDLAQWLAVKARVAALGLQAVQTDAALRANRVKLQAFQKDPSWHHVARRSVDPNATTNLRALIQTQCGALAAVTDGDLAAAAELRGWKAHLIRTPGDLVIEIDKVCAAEINKSTALIKPSLQDMRDALFPDSDSPAEKVEALMAMLPDNEILDHVSPEVRNAVQAIQNLSPRERGAIYRYTNKLHEQFGYATTGFTTATDFTPTDLQNTTDKLRTLPFMLPIVQALNSALEA